MAISAAIVVGAVVAGAAISMIGNSKAQKKAAAAQAAYQKLTADEADKLDKLIPTVESQMLTYRPLESQGIYTPEQERAISLGSSELANVTTDPRLRSAQMQALEQLASMGQTPFTEAEQAQLNQVRRQSAGDEQARQSAILQEMATRGVGGSGAELAARLSSSQAAAERQSTENDQLAIMAQNRMLQALSQSGSLGGQIREQDYGEQSAAAQAADRIAQFNALQTADVQQRNIGGLNLAQAQNLAEKQRLSEANIGTQMTLEQQNKQLLPQQYFGNQAQISAIRTGGQVAGTQMLSAIQGAKGAAQAQIGSALVGAAGQMGAAYATKGSSSKPPVATKSDG